MPPNDGNFFHLESQLAREEQDFGVEPPALNFLQWKDRERCRAFECFESTLRVFEMQAEREAQQQIEDSTKDLTVYWLALGLSPARSQREPIAISVFSSSALKKLGRFFDWRRQVGVAEDEDLSPAVEYSVADTITLASIPGILN